MSAPSQQGIPVGGYYPSLSLINAGIKRTSLLFTDNYSKFYKPLGIRRYEMMRIMPYMMTSDVLVGLDLLEYIDEGKDKIENIKKIAPHTYMSKFPFIEKIEISFTDVDTSGMPEKQKNRIDVGGLSRWNMKIYNKKDKLTDELINDINEIAINRNKIPIKYLKVSSELCSYISQKARVFGETESKQDIRNASVVIEPLHNDIFNMIIPHLPINQSLPLGTKVVINAEIPYKGKDSVRKFIWSSNLSTDRDIMSKIKANKPDSLTLEPWLMRTHFSSMELGSSIKGKFEVAEVDTSLQQSYQIYTFQREAEDAYFELGMYVCYNMYPNDLIDALLKLLPNNKYLKAIHDTLN